MQCPNDHTLLVIADRQGVEIDYCPKCRGVWLDRGELDKLIERATSYQIPHQPQERQERREEHREEPRYEDRSREMRGLDDDDDHRRHSGGHKSHKKESFLGDLFDF